MCEIGVRAIKRLKREIRATELAIERAEQRNDPCVDDIRFKLNELTWLLGKVYESEGEFVD